MKKLILLTIFLITTTFCKAQKNWNFEIGASSTINSGNVNDLSFKNNETIKRNDSLVSYELNFKFVYNRKDRQETNKGTTAGFKTDLFQYGKWSPFWAMEYTSNKYKGYDNKWSALAGIKYRIFSKQDTCDYSLSLAGVYDNVDYTPEENTLDRQVYRLSVRPKFKQKIGEALTLKHNTFYQPDFKDFRDYIITSTTVLENKLGKKFFLEIRFEYEYRSKVPTEDYKNSDICTEIGLKIKI